jgi:phospho-N-acetylmuramoyl-pentapeptide-transferase
MLSVIIQLTSKKFFKRKVFRIAPIHHHFEQKGWKEFTIVMRFWIIGGIMAVFGTILGLINLA